MLLPNINAVLLLLMMWYYSAPTQARSSLGMKPRSSRRLALPRFMAWMADLLWVPLLAYMGQPIITDMLRTFGHQQFRLLCGLIIGFILSLVIPRLLFRERVVEDQHASM